MSKEIDINTLVDLVSNKMKSSGVEISRIVLELAIKSYNEVKAEQMLEGNTIVEDGLGRITPSWRRLSNQFATVPYTSKLAVKIDPKLKKQMNYLIETNPEYRAAIGAQEL